MAGITGNPRPHLQVYLGRIIDSIKYTLVDRGETYGDFEDNAKIYWDLLGAMGLQPTLPPGMTPCTAIGLMYKAMKMSRVVADSNHADNWIDDANYGLLVLAVQQRAAEAAAAPDTTLPRPFRTDDVAALSDREQLRIELHCYLDGRAIATDGKDRYWCWEEQLATWVKCNKPDPSAATFHWATTLVMTEDDVVEARRVPRYVPDHKE